MDEFAAEPDEADLDETIEATPEMISSLMSRLRDKDGQVREKARLSLVYIGEPAVAPLIDALSDRRKNLRWEAARALSDIASSTAVPALVTALQDKDFDVRWLAAQGLIAIGCEAVVPLLEALLEYSDSVWLRQGAHHVLHDLEDDELEKILEPVMAALESLDPEVEVPLAAKVALYSLTR